MITIINVKMKRTFKYVILYRFIYWFSQKTDTVDHFRTTGTVKSSWTLFKKSFTANVTVKNIH